MKRQIVLLAGLLCLAFVASAQYSLSNVGASVPAAEINSKPAFQLVSGPPTALTGTAGKDFAYDFAGQKWSIAKVSGSPATWAQVEELLTFSAGLTRAGQSITCAVASGSVAGCLSTADWTAFNSKLANPFTTTGDISMSTSGTTGGRLAAGAADTFLRGNGAGVAPSYGALVDCVAAGGVEQYSTSTHLWSCHTLALGDIPNSVAIVPVSFSATPTFTVPAGATDVTFTIASLTGNVTSSTLVSAASPVMVTVRVCQDATGSRTFAFPANFINYGTISALANKCSVQKGLYDGTNVNATTPMVTDNTPGGISGNAKTATALAANGTNCSAGSYPLGVDASGNAEGCTVASGGGGDMLTATYNLTSSGAPSNPCTTAGSWDGDTTTTPVNFYRCPTAGGNWAGPFSVYDGTKSGATLLSGLTSGASGFAVNDVAGTAILYLMPVTNGTAGKTLIDTGSATCPTLASGMPSVCHQLLWVDRYSYAAGGGTANAQTAAYTPATAALADGLRLCWKPTAANTTTTPTFSPDALTAHTIVKAGGALVANDIITTAIACAVYNTTGTHWELQNPQTTPSGGGDVTTTGTNTYTSSAVNDARAAAHTLPAKTGTTSSIPGTCTVGEEYFASDATAGQNKYFCSATNTWTQQLNSGGGLTQTHSVSFVVYNNGSVLAAGNSYVGQLPAACTITGYSLAADASGSISIDLSAHANASQATAPAVPNTTTDKISASAPMILSSAQTNADTTLTGWSKTRAIWDSFLVNVTGTPATVTKVMGQVFCQ